MKKTLKFLSMATLILAVATLTGCSKEEEQAAEPAVVKTCTTTVSIEGNEASKALTEAGVKTFATNDKIAVVYETSSGWSKAEVTLDGTTNTISADGKTATFTVELTNPKSNGEVKYIYPASMANTTSPYDVDYTKLYEQDGSLTTLAANYDLGYYSSTLDAEGNLPASCQLNNPLVIASFTLKESGTTINSGVTMLFIGDGTNSYYITRAAAADSIWVAMKPMAASTVVSFHAIANGDRYEKEAFALPAALVAGHITPIRLSMTKLKQGALFGKFSMGSGVTKHFSQGNLRYASGWSFFPNQYDYYTTYSADAWDKFGWSTPSTTYGMSTSTNNGDYSGSFVDWGRNAIGGNAADAYSTPSAANWEYLFGGSEGRTSASSKYGTATITVEGNDKHGLVVLPDHWTLPNGCSFTSGMIGWSTNSYDATAWAKMEAAGAVFLPAAGYREGEDVGDYSGYWSSTANHASSAQVVGFIENYVDPNVENGRYCGQSVRLVCE